MTNDEVTAPEGPERGRSSAHPCPPPQCRATVHGALARSCRGKVPAPFAYRPGQAVRTGEFCALGPTASGVPGAPPGMAGSNSQDADSHNRVTARHEIVQNEPNFAPAHAAHGGEYAKRSQTWDDWGIWAKAAVVWAVARPGSETCKTNPILGKRLTASLRTGLLCRTNPICGRPESTLTTPAEMGYDKKGGLRPCENKANSQKGFDTQRHCFMSWPRTGSKLPALSLPFVEGASKMSPRKRSQRRGSGPRNDCVRE
jgi:hypothetical protein